MEDKQSLILRNANGVVVRQQTQKVEAIAQSVGIGYEARNKYKLSILPDGKKVGTHPNDQEMWKPTANELIELDQYMFVAEESGCLTRCLLTSCGCGMIRPLTLHFRVASEDGDAYLVRRPFNCGGWICCPSVMNIFSRSNDGEQLIGRVKEDFGNYMGKCWSCCCLCTYYNDIEKVGSHVGQFEKLFTLRVNLCCCGRVNNCCGGSCLRNDAVFDILDTNDTIVANLQITYGPGKCACCRTAYKFNNYMLSFPQDSEPEQRALLIASIFQIDYQFFDAKN